MFLFYYVVMFILTVLWSLCNLLWLTHLKLTKVEFLYVMMKSILMAYLFCNNKIYSFETKLKWCWPKCQTNYYATIFVVGVAIYIIATNFMCCYRTCLPPIMIHCIFHLLPQIMIGCITFYCHQQIMW